MTLFGPHIRPLLCLGALAVLAGPGAQAPLAAQIPTAKAGKRLRAGWEISQFTWVKLVPAEAGAAGSQHPVALDFQALSTQLGAIRLVLPDGEEPLFSPDELNNLRKPLCQAFAAARPDEDVLVLSTNRRSSDLMKEPTAITARMFWRDEVLQVIVHDARFAFFVQYRTTGRMPDFVFGSRDTPGEPRIQLPGGDHPQEAREDWVQVSLEPGAVAATLAASRPPAPVQAASAVPAPVVEPAPAPAAHPVAAAAGAEPVRAAALVAGTAAAPTSASAAGTAAASATGPAAAPTAAPATGPAAAPTAAPTAAPATGQAAAPTAAPADGQAAASAAGTVAGSVPTAAPAGESTRYTAWERRLRALKQLRREDLITEAEYQQKCQQLLDEL